MVTWYEIFSFDPKMGNKQLFFLFVKEHSYVNDPQNWNIIDFKIKFKEQLSFGFSVFKSGKIDYCFVHILFLRK